MNKIKNILKNFAINKRIQNKEHEEIRRINNEFNKREKELKGKHRELRQKFNEEIKQAKKDSDAPRRISRNEYLRNLSPELRKQFNELHHSIYELRMNKAEFHRLHWHVRLSPFLIIILNIFIWIFLYRFTGFQGFSIFLAILISFGGIFELIFLRKIEQRVILPVEKIKNAAEEISKGNFDVQISNENSGALKELIDSFNNMSIQLKESERLKKDYEENRKALIANISHDLKTPITSIQGYIEAISETGDIPKENLDKYLKIIYNNAAYMNKLIDDLFVFSKLDMEKLEFQFENIPVKAFMSDLMEEFLLEFDERHVSFDYKDMLEKDCVIKIDMKRIHQVLKNIIGNALKYGPDEGLIISTKMEMSDNFVAIRISDNGPGIPEDKLTHIFERFYRLDSERTKDLVSTGLGLAISKELVEAHGGNISVDSRLDYGSCFTVKLPVCDLNK